MGAVLSDGGGGGRCSTPIAPRPFIGSYPPFQSSTTAPPPPPSPTHPPVVPAPARPPPPAPLPISNAAGPDVGPCPCPPPPHPPFAGRWRRPGGVVGVATAGRRSHVRRHDATPPQRPHSNADAGGGVRGGTGCRPVRGDGVWVQMSGTLACGLHPDDGGQGFGADVSDSRRKRFRWWWWGGVDGPDSAWRNRAPGPHRNTARQAMDGLWTEVCGRQKQSNDPRQQPAHPQYANYWAPLTRKRHTIPHSAQPRHTNYWAPRTWKRHQQEHRPQRPTERSDPTQHAKGRPGDCPGPRKGATTRRNVTQGGRSSE